MEKSKVKIFRHSLLGMARVSESAAGYGMRQYVIAIGDDSNPISNNQSKQYVIKMFSLLNFHQPLYSFSPLANVPSTATLTAFNVTPNGTQIAVGFSSGTVSIFLNNFLKQTFATADITNVDNWKTVLDMPTPQIFIPSQPYPVSKLVFADLPSSLSLDVTNDSEMDLEERVFLYIVIDKNADCAKVTISKDTANNFGITSDVAPSKPAADSAGIFAVDVSLRVDSVSGLVSLSSKRKAAQFLDEDGALAACVSYMADTRELIVGREPGIFSYSPEDRGGAVGLEGSKTFVQCIRNYILVASDMVTGGSSSIISGDDGTSIMSGSASTASSREIVTIYDLRNKIIVGTTQLVSSVQFFFFFIKCSTY